jgi:hypothetical protein
MSKMTPHQMKITSAAIAKRNRQLRAGTAEAAAAMWKESGLGLPVTPDVPLAGLHKARIVWPDATDEEVQASRAWLAEHGFKAPVRPVK